MRSRRLRRFQGEPVRGMKGMAARGVYVAVDESHPFLSVVLEVRNSVGNVDAFVSFRPYAAEELAKRLIEAAAEARKVHESESGEVRSEH